LKTAEAELNVYTINLAKSVTTNSERFSSKSPWQSVPAMFFGQPITDKLSWGFGTYSPYGLGADWGQGSPFRTVVTSAKLVYSNTAVALAYDVTDTISVGASASLVYTNLELEQGIGLSPLDFLKVKADGFTAAGELGVRWAPNAQNSFGLTAATGTSQTLKGKVYSNVFGTGPGDITFKTPMRVAFGYAYKPAPGWNIEANLEWLDWDSLNSLYLTSAHAPGGGTIAVPFNWQSMLIYELGVSHTWDNGMTVAGGYDYNCNAQPDRNYNPVIGDADFQSFNLGVGRKLDCWSWFLTYQFGYAHRDVRGAQNTPAGQNANGKYNEVNNAVVLSLGYKF
jgi:long-chain fatty acid transport protein